MFLQQLFNGITQGSIYALIAIGYAMVFSLLELINFAHGGLFMAGAFMGLFLIANLQLNLVAGFVLAMAGTALLGVVLERTAIYPLSLRGAGKVPGLISTLGMGIVIENVAILTLGTSVKPFPLPFTQVFYKVGPAQISNLELVILGLGLFLVVALQAFVKNTDAGVAMRAASQDMETAQLMGVNTNRVVITTFALGSALAAAAGILVAMYYNFVEPTMGAMAGLKGFTASVLGGRGLISGAVLGGFVLGVAESLGAAYIRSGYKDIIAFTILVLVLLIKPTGILGGRRGEKV